MYFTFQNRKLAKEFSDEKTLRRKKGDKQAKLIMQRLAELTAAENLEVLRSLPAPRCHELKGIRKGQLSVDLNHPYRLIFVPDHEPVPQSDMGGMNWKKITKIKILGVYDTHD